MKLRFYYLNSTLESQVFYEILSCTSDAPANNFSYASEPVLMPPTPTIGI